MSPSRARVRSTAWWAAAAVAAGVLVPAASLVLARGLDAPAPAGSDPDIWLLSSLDLPDRLPLRFPPLYPGLVAAVHALGGVELVQAGLSVSLLSLALVALLLAGAARRAGASGALLAVALAALVGNPDLVFLGLRLGPDSLAAASLGLVAVVTTGPRAPRVVALAAALLAACLVREVGLVVCLLVGGAATLQPGLSWPRRAATLTATAGALLLCPVLAGTGPLLPWEWPWLARVMAGSVTAGSGVEFPPQVPTWAHDLAADGGPGLLLAQSAFAVTQAPGSWLLVALGALAALRARRWPLLALLLSSVAALTVWSAPRHVAVFLPAAMIAVITTGAGSRSTGSRSTGSRSGRWVLALVVAGVAALPTWRARVALLRHESRDIHSLRLLGAEICDLAGPGDLASGEPRAFLYCPMPRTDHPEGSEETAWHAWVAEHKPPGESWGKLPLQSDAFMIFRYRPDLAGADRPCAHSRPDPATRYFETHGHTMAKMSPPCSASPAAGGDPSSLEGVRERLRQRQQRRDGTR